MYIIALCIAISNTISHEFKNFYIYCFIVSSSFEFNILPNLLFYKIGFHQPPLCFDLSFLSRLTSLMQRKIVIDLSAIVFIHRSRSVEQRCQHICLDVSDLARVSVKAVENILDVRRIDTKQPRSDNLPRQIASCNHTIRGLRYNRFKHKLNKCGCL